MNKLVDWTKLKNRIFFKIIFVEDTICLIEYATCASVALHRLHTRKLSNNCVHGRPGNQKTAPPLFGHFKFTQLKIWCWFYSLFNNSDHFYNFRRFFPATLSAMARLVENSFSTFVLFFFNVVKTRKWVRIKSF